MPELVVVAPHGNEWRLSLDAEEYVIGRDPNVPIPLNDLRVSRRHARLYRERGGFWIEDLGSSNGVRVDGVALRGPQPLASGAHIDIGGYQLAFAGENVMARGGATFSLIGQNGPTARQTMELPRGSVDVGRSSKCSIVVEDASLSRRHAVLHVTPVSLEVEDAGSSNGTFVNDLPVSRQVLNGGDYVRFGQVSFLVAVSAPKQSAPGSSLRRLLQRLPRPSLATLDRSTIVTATAAILAGILFCAASIVLYHHTFGNPTRTRPIGKEERAYEELIRNGLNTATSRMQGESWAEAVSAYQEVLERDPINSTARDGLAVAELNTQQQAAIAAAQEALQAGQPARALSLIASIAPNAHYANVAAAITERARMAIGILAQNEAQLACRRDEFPRCHQQAIVLLTYIPGSPVGMALVVESEAGLAARRVPFSPWGGHAPPKKSPLATWYRDPEVRAALLRYGSGDIETALRRLHTFTRHPGAAGATNLLLELRRNKLAGDNAAAAGDEAAAIRYWQAALQRDAKLLPANNPSTFGSDLRNRLGALHLRQGEAAFNRGSYAEAFASWQKGIELDPTNADLAAAVAKLEGRAANLLAEQAALPKVDEAACGQLRDIMAMTTGDSPTHKAARDKMAACKQLR